MIWLTGFLKGSWDISTNCVSSAAGWGLGVWKPFRTITVGVTLPKLSGATSYSKPDGDVAGLKEGFDPKT